MRTTSPHFESNPRSALLISMLWLALPVTTAADISTTGIVTPPEVTTGTVNGPVVLGDFPTLQPGSLTIDGGSSLVVNDTSVFGGISVNVPFDFMAVSGGTLESTAGVALNVDRNSNVIINNGSQVILRADQGVFPRTALLIGSRGGSGVVSSVNVDGVGTDVDVIGAVNIAGLSGGETAELNLSNGASIANDASLSQLSGSFGGVVVGGNGSIGEINLSTASTLQSEVPQTVIGRQLFGLIGVGSVDLSGSSLYEATTEMTVGKAGGEGTVTLDGSTMRVIENVLAPVTYPGSVFVAIGDSTSLGSILMDNSSILEIDNRLFIGHDGIDSTGNGTGLVSVCNSTLTADEILIGENGTLAGSTINADIVVEGGTINPGCSPGDMTVNGDLRVTKGELVIEIDGPGAFDTITVLGTADFSSVDAGIQLSFGNGYAPAEGDTIEFIAADTLNLPADPTVLISFTGLTDDIEFSIAVDADGFDFTAEEDGIPEEVASQIDIRPGGPNHVNTESDQLVPVAILTTQDAPIFDATMVDPSTVRFGPLGATPTPGKIKLKDVDHDGDLDLRLWFRVQDTGIACGDTTASLTGQTVVGTEITAADELVVVNCH